MPHDVTHADTTTADESAESIEPALVPPVAPAVPEQRELHGQTWVDEYAWMSEHDNPEFLAHLAAERQFYDESVGHLAQLAESVFDEVDRRVLPTDESVSWKRGAFFYYSRTVAGSEYGQFMSTRNPAVAGRVVLDESELARVGDRDERDHDVDAVGYVSLGVREVSPDGQLLAYAFDTTGDEVFTLRFRDLHPDRDLTGDDDLMVTGFTEEVPRVYYGGAWSSDSTHFFYVVQDAAHRPYQVWRHAIGTESSSDLLVYTETDARFEVTVRASTSGAYLFIETASRDTTETWLLPADQPTGAPRLLAGRRRGIEYRVDHADHHLYIVTNDGAPEFRLMRAPVAAAHRNQWREVTPPRPGERLFACHALANFLLLELRREGFPLLRVVDRASGEEREIHPETAAGRLILATKFEYRATSVTIQVDSLIEPPRWFDVDLRTGQRMLRKMTYVPGYDPNTYHTERRRAQAADGTQVPLTLAWRDGTPLNGTAPCVMWGYGAYESCDDPSFDMALPSLLDRGVVYVLTHPRGGGELGRGWWQAGRLAAKPNTFADHVTVADWLAGVQPQQPALIDGERIVTRGLSAGGLLQGVVFATRPDRWRAVVAEVPFVDVLNTMLDPSIPLTVNEYDEWGDPRVPEMFALLAAYSPYENTHRGRRHRGQRPALLVTGALHDSRVMVHEPAKWVARLRANAADGDGVILFRPELGAAAHGGPAGRYAHYRYESEVYAFMLEQLGLVEATPAPSLPVQRQPVDFGTGSFRTISSAMGQPGPASADAEAEADYDEPVAPLRAEYPGGEPSPYAPFAPPPAAEPLPSRVAESPYAPPVEPVNAPPQAGPVPPVNPVPPAATLQAFAPPAAVPPPAMPQRATPPAGAVPPAAVPPAAVPPGAVPPAAVPPAAAVPPGAVPPGAVPQGGLVERSPIDEARPSPFGGLFEAVEVEPVGFNVAGFGAGRGGDRPPATDDAPTTVNPVVPAPRQAPPVPPADEEDEDLEPTMDAMEVRFRDMGTPPGGMPIARSMPTGG
jgi:oligopeptidase B